MGYSWVACEGYTFLGNFHDWDATKAAADAEYKAGRRVFDIGVDLETPKYALPLVPPASGYDLYVMKGRKITGGATFGMWSDWGEWIDRISIRVRRDEGVWPFKALFRVSLEGIMGATECSKLAAEFTLYRPVARKTMILRGERYRHLYVDLYNNLAKACHLAKDGGLVRFL